MLVLCAPWERHDLFIRMVPDGGIVFAFADSDGGIVSSAPGEDEIKVPVGGGRRGMPRRSVSEAPGKGPMSELPDGDSPLHLCRLA